MLAALFGVAGAICALSPLNTPASLQVALMGNHRGYLTPCGCSQPMLGGILRQATVIRGLRRAGPTLVVDTGDLIGGHSRQETLKVETLVQTLKSLEVDAVNLTSLDTSLGVGELINLQNLSGTAFTSLDPSKMTELDLPRSKEAEGFFIAGLSRAAPATLAERAREIASESRKKGLKSLLMLDGDEKQAMEIARQAPGVDIVAFTSSARPTPHPSVVGSTLLVSPGEHGEYMVVLDVVTGRSPSVRVIPLGPEIHDDPSAARFYEGYLKRVEGEHLWEQMPRQTSSAFSGSAACGSCHVKEFDVWQHSGHAHALATLAKQKHVKDPECVPCHVTGARFTAGYRSLAVTPHLAFVGCESCHGAGGQHSRRPRRFHLKAQTPYTCTTCHSPLNSPNFELKSYWLKILHGSGGKRWIDRAPGG